MKTFLRLLFFAITFCGFSHQLVAQASGWFGAASAIGTYDMNYRRVAINADPNWSWIFWNGQPRFSVFEVGLDATLGNWKTVTSIGGTPNGSIVNYNTVMYRVRQGDTWSNMAFHHSIDVDNFHQKPHGPDGWDPNRGFNNGTKCWWEQDPARGTQAWGNADKVGMVLNPNNSARIFTPTSGDLSNIGSFTLVVEGKIGSRNEVTVLNPGVAWPDYVFAPGYKLRTLPETEAYIQANGHLPEVPSAKEVEKEGVNLSAMNAALLQKIEELTLHVIQLRKELDELKKGR
jgi:hypothetical protein